MPITTFTRTMRHPNLHIPDTLTQVVEYDSLMGRAKVLGSMGRESSDLGEIIQHLDERYAQWVERLSHSRDMDAAFAAGLIGKGFEIVKIESDF